MEEEGFGDHERHQRLSDSNRTAHHESVSKMLAISGAICRQNHGENKQRVGEQVDGTTADGEG